MGVIPYPAEPWDLHGRAYVGVWLLPRGVTPPPHSSRTKVVRVFGRAIVSAAFFVYEEPSPLTYNEIMATVLVRHGWRPRVSITHIWVDSAASRDGGRDLWAIPKELAEFEVVPQTSYVASDIGSMALQGERRLPWRVPLRFRIAQDRDGALVTSPVAGRVHVGFASASWSFSPDGAMGFLASRRPLVTLVVRPFRLLFGHRS